MTSNDQSIFPGDGVPGRSLTFIGLALLVGLLVYIFGWSANFQEPATGKDMLSGGDYLQFFVAGQLIQHGLNDSLYDFEYVRAFQHDPAVIPYEWDPDVFGLYIYPPFFVWFCLPFSYLSFHAGAIAWATVMAGFLLAAILLMARTLPSGRRHFGWLLLGCLFFRPVVMSLYTCQNATLSLLILAACYSLLRGNRPFVAGLVFALLAFKPQLTLVLGLGMLCTRQWRFVGGAIVGGLALLGASLAVSPASTLEYFRVAPSMSRWIDMPGMPLERMSCWYGFWRLAFAGQSLVYVQAATAITTAATLVPLVCIMRRTRRSDHALRFASLVLGSVVLSPHLLSYDLTLLVLPLALLATLPTVANTGGGLNPMRCWAAVLFVGACYSDPIAAVTGVQLVVPLMTLTLVFLYKSIEQRTVPAVQIPCST